jgi:hypothetical protein
MKTPNAKPRPSNKKGKPAAPPTKEQERPSPAAQPQSLAERLQRKHLHRFQQPLGRSVLPVKEQ